ncbi:hypothetical protein [Brevundimonas sp. LjRoot202]|uniref:hypothetical protein n=1 Tax=Brevundimonas sp. LjRoot202 TaxID=3342281 RepID=UPI003ECFE0E8
MRRGRAAAGLLLALAVAACAPPAGLAAVAPDGDAPPDRPTLVVCTTILGTMSNAIREGRATGDHAAVRAGYAAYGRMAAKVMGDEGSRQAIGSSYAFYDSLTPAQLSAASDMCLAAVDRDFSEDDWW